MLFIYVYIRSRGESDSESAHLHLFCSQPQYVTYAGNVHLPLIAVGSNPVRDWIVLCEEAIKLAYGTSVVLPRCPLVPEIMHGGSSKVFLHQ